MEDLAGNILKLPSDFGYCSFLLDGSVDVDSSFASAVCGVLRLVFCFVMQYLVSFVVLQSSRCGEKSWLFYFNYVLFYLWLLEFCALSVGLWSVIMSFPDHSHLHLAATRQRLMRYLILVHISSVTFKMR